MQVLTVLLLIVGVGVLAIAGFVGISYGLGVHLYRRDSTRFGATGRDPCAQSYADRDWYLALPLWQQTAITAWWWANRFQWAAKGCK